MKAGGVDELPARDRHFLRFAVQGGEHQCDSALFPQDVLKWRQFPTFSGLCYKKMGEQSGIGEQVGAKIESHPEKS